MDADSDSDAPEELTTQQGTKQEEEIRKIQRENKLRVSQEGKERRRKWAQRKTQQSNRAQDVHVIHDVAETELQEEAQITHGMLPTNVVELLAARERQVFLSDTEEETIINEPVARKKKQKLTGEPVLLTDIPPAKCLENSLEFLKKRKMDVPRSQATLKNAERALRLISSRGCLRTKS
ncbi:hypothetical protein Taro_042159 [Colocasia esculenta]|uniref:Uncharacterized protein n=1 Tax=Colocasia esculenta TaxID=4460 RepID=A0A843WVP8_COLES|nr:hypothetical protein [Colocasia esculenta]